MKFGNDTEHPSLSMARYSVLTKQQIGQPHHQFLSSHIKIPKMQWLIFILGQKSLDIFTKKVPFGGFNTKWKTQCQAMESEGS